MRHKLAHFLPTLSFPSFKISLRFPEKIRGKREKRLRRNIHIWGEIFFFLFPQMIFLSNKSQKLPGRERDYVRVTFFYRRRKAKSKAGRMSHAHSFLRKAQEKRVYVNSSIGF